MAWTPRYLPRVRYALIRQHCRKGVMGSGSDDGGTGRKWAWEERDGQESDLAGGTQGSSRILALMSS